MSESFACLAVFDYDLLRTQIFLLLSILQLVSSHFESFQVSVQVSTKAYQHSKTNVNFQSSLSCLFYSRVPTYPLTSRTPKAPRYLFSTSSFPMLSLSRMLLPWPPERGLKGTSTPTAT